MNVRRLIAVLAIATCSIADVAAETTPTRVELEFEVLRKDKPMGSHTIRVTREGPDLIAEIAIDLEVRFAFITLFEYHHRNREVWRDDRLIGIETMTENNGERFRITGHATDAGFVVQDSDGVERTFDADVLPSSYWHPRTREAGALLNTQTGELATVAITPAVADAVSPRGTLYVVSGDIDLNLWYADICLSKLNFRAPSDNSLIDYRRAISPTADACPARLLEGAARRASLDETAR